VGCRATRHTQTFRRQAQGENGRVAAVIIPASLLELADQRSAEGEQNRSLHPDVFNALAESGMLRGWVAEEFGGRAVSVTEVLSEIEAVSVADGAAGWSVMIGNTTALNSHRLPTEWAEHIYRDPLGCTGGFGMPTATGTVVDGGLSVTGRWSWGSGTDHCTFIGGGVRIVDESGESARTPDGASTPFVYFEPDQIELLDTWHVVGLKGTASTDYSVTDAFVPSGRWTQLVGNESLIDTTLGRFPFFSALACGVAAVTIGLGVRAINEVIALGERKFAGSSTAMASRAPAQADLAMAIASVGQARSYLHEAANRVWDQIAEGGEAADAQRVELRIAAAAAAQRSVEAVDLCYHAVGGAAVFESSPLQRVFRDVHVAITHGMINPRIFEPMGRFHFGLPTNTQLF
jgi:alkylation response protein AidB-like acyl-CoA dehydrogenase